MATAISIATDLERMGDHAVNVSEIVLRIGKTPLIKPLVDIPEMADSAQRMISGCLDAFVRRDVDLARQTCRNDDAVDRTYQALFDELVELTVHGRDEDECSGSQSALCSAVLGTHRRPRHQHWRARDLYGYRGEGEVLTQ